MCLQQQFNIAFNNANAKCDVRLTLIAKLTIHQYANMHKYACLSTKKIANGCQVSKFDKCMWFYIIKIQDFEYKLFITYKVSQGIQGVNQKIRIRAVRPQLGK